jgi:hypothetical protein
MHVLAGLVGVVSGTEVVLLRLPSKGQDIERTITCIEPTKFLYNVDCGKIPIIHSPTYKKYIEEIFPSLHVYACAVSYLLTNLPSLEYLTTINLPGPLPAT